MAVALHRENNPPWETFIRGAEMEKLSSREKAENNNTHLRPSLEDRLCQSNARLASFSLATTLQPADCCTCYSTSLQVSDGQSTCVCRMASSKQKHGLHPFPPAENGLCILSPHWSGLCTCRAHRWVLFIPLMGKAPCC